MSEREKKKSGLLVLVILLIVFAGLVFMYYLIGYLSAQSEEEENDEEGQLLISENLDEVNTFSYDIDGVRQTFLKEDGEWIYAEDTEIKLDQDLVQSMLDGLQDLQSEQIVADSLANSSDYGFDDPYMTITLSFTDGTQTILYIGSQNPMVDVYYLIIEGDDKIYTVSSDVPSIFLSVSDLEEQEDETEDTDTSAGETDSSSSGSESSGASDTPADASGDTSE